MKRNIKYFAGVDVQITRGFCYYVIDSKKNYVSSGWVKADMVKKLNSCFREIAQEECTAIAIGIDAPRMPMSKLRPGQKRGRQCEVILKSLRIGNPQWTTTLEDSPEWMKLGFLLYDSLKEFPFVYEVFPSASYKMLEEEKVKYQLCLKAFKPGPKDMLDASVAAITVYEYLQGRGCEVGGEDGLGTIVLPRTIKK